MSEEAEEESDLSDLWDAEVETGRMDDSQIQTPDLSPKKRDQLLAQVHEFEPTLNPAPR